MMKLMIASCLALLCAASASAEERVDCRLCDPAAQSTPSLPEQRPLHIEIETSLNFSRVAQSGEAGGEVKVRAADGGRQVGGALIDLGGLALAGSALVTGTPYAMIRIDLPNRVEMRTSNGDVAIVEGLETDLPTISRLDSNGSLRFSFGGRMIVKGAVSGSFRGRIPISVDYQ